MFTSVLRTISQHGRRLRFTTWRVSKGHFSFIMRVLVIIRFANLLFDNLLLRSALRACLGSQNLLWSIIWRIWLTIFITQFILRCFIRCCSVMALIKVYNCFMSAFLQTCLKWTSRAIWGWSGSVLVFFVMSTAWFAILSISSATMSWAWRFTELFLINLIQFLSASLDFSFVGIVR